MPGIVALIDQNLTEFNNNREIVKNISFRSCFEKFYTVDFLECNELGIHASVVRFKEIPQSHVICKTPFTCLFFGQLFITGELKSISQANNIACNKDMDGAQFISFLYQKGGISALSLLNGTFHLLLIDDIQKKNNNNE